MFDSLTELGTSALSPAGAVAQSIDQLYWVMVVVFGLVFIVTIGLLAIGLLGKRKDAIPKPPLGDTWFIIICGLIVPGIILAGILVYTLVVTASLHIPSSNALIIDLTGHMWWWEVEYEETGIRTANEIYIPVGEPVLFRLHSGDVIHSFWVPSLSGKTDLIPGVTNTHWLEASKPGVYRGQCAEFCGLQHARMALYIIALPREEFDSWINRSSQPPEIPTTGSLRRGYQSFFEVGCAECHAIRGTPAISNIGPDLTLIGSRRSLAAGTVPNNHETLADWVTHPQEIKPGNRMPATHIDPPELEALIEYLMSLK